VSYCWTRPPPKLLIHSLDLDSLWCNVIRQDQTADHPPQIHIVQAVNTRNGDPVILFNIWASGTSWFLDNWYLWRSVWCLWPSIEVDAKQVKTNIYNPDVDITGVDEHNLIRKIDLSLISWLSFLYLLSFLDRKVKLPSLRHRDFNYTNLVKTVRRSGSCIRCGWLNKAIAREKLKNVCAPSQTNSHGELPDIDGWVRDQFYGLKKDWHLTYVY